MDRPGNHIPLLPRNYIFSPSLDAAILTPQEHCHFYAPSSIILPFLSLIFFPLFLQNFPTLSLQPLQINFSSEITMADTHPVIEKIIGFIMPGDVYNIAWSGHESNWLLAGTAAGLVGWKVGTTLT
jgi:hypothetical protein